MKKRQRRHGFSLLELMIVLSILTIIAAIGIPRLLQGRANQSLRVQATEFKSDLELAKSYAKGGGSEISFEFQSPAGSSPGYVIRDADGNMRKQVEFRHGVTADYSGLNNTELIFKSTGAINTDGQIVIASGNSPRTFTMQLNKTTGMIKVIESD